MTAGEAVVDRVHLGVTVPRREWDEFLDVVVERWGGWVPYAGFEIDVAWREYRHTSPAEDFVARLYEAAGLPRDALTKNKPETRKPLSDFAGDEKQRARVRVARPTKEGIRQFAAAEGTRQHEIVRALLAWVVGGGREGRIADKLERVTDDAEALLAEVNPGADGGMGVVERRAVAVAKALIDWTPGDGGEDVREIPVPALEGLVREHASVESAPSVAKYVERIAERFDLVRQDTPGDAPDMYRARWAIAEQQREQQPTPDDVGAEADDTMAQLDAAQPTAVADGGTVGG